MKNLRIVNRDNHTIINYYHIPNRFDKLLIELLNNKGVATKYDNGVLSISSLLTQKQEDVLKSILPEYYRNIGMCSSSPEGDPLLLWDIEEITNIINNNF